MSSQIVKRTVEVARNPGVQCLDVSPFPCGRLCRHCVGGSGRLSGNRYVRQLVREHREVARQTMRETELGIGGEGTGEVLRGIGPVFQIRQDRAVKAGSCFHGRCGDRQSMLILKHCRSPFLQD